MQHMFSFKAFYMILFLIAGLVSFSTFNGCDDSGVESEDPVSHVVHFDSIWVQEDSNGTGFAGINLLDGVNTNVNFNMRDASLGGGTGPNGDNFFLRSGILDNLLDAGYISKWFQVADNYTQAEFDTMTAVYTNIGSAFDTTDFTQESTEFWGYFNYPMTEFPVYCFWLVGKRDGGLTNGKNVFGILRPKMTEDTNPGGVYGFSMVVEVRINTNGLNDFRHTNH
jgi:hypothetical protein